MGGQQSNAVQVHTGLAVQTGPRIHGGGAPEPVKAAARAIPQARLARQRHQQHTALVRSLRQQGAGPYVA